MAKHPCVGRRPRSGATRELSRAHHSRQRRMVAIRVAPARAGASEASHSSVCSSPPSSVATSLSASRKTRPGKWYASPSCASSLVRMAQSYFTALLFSGYLLYNTQLMMGGDKSRQVRPDEWLLAAVSIYTDVINLFMAILEIMNSQEQRR